MASSNCDIFDYEVFATMSLTTRENYFQSPVIDLGSIESLTLEASEDMFGDMVIDSIRLPDISLFRQSLRHSLTQWKAQDKRAVWLKLTVNQGAFMPPAIQEGFNFHYAEPTYGMLVIWLADNVPSAIPANPPTIPANASTKTHQCSSDPRQCCSGCH